MLRILFFGFSIVSIITLDQITKYWIRVNFALHETLAIIEGFFNITYVRNPGAAFGFLASANNMIRKPLLLILPVAICIVLVFMMRQVWRKNILLEIAYCLILAGALGNLIDRFYFGYVIDFLDFHLKGQHFPAFNVADSCITVAAGFLIIDFIRELRLKKTIAQ